MPSPFSAASTAIPGRKQNESARHLHTCARLLPDDFLENFDQWA